MNNNETRKSSKNYKVRKDNIFYFHTVQSFLPNETTPEQAHKIGIELMRKHYGPHVQVVIATHIDKAHIHNHFVINSVSLSCEKFHSNKDTLNKMRNNSDILCRQNGLSVIVPKSKNQNYSYKEWQERKNNNSWKEDLRLDLDKAILQSNSFDKFKNILKQQGYEFKEPRKYLTIRKKGYERYIRTKTLGDDYIEERIKERIANENKLNIADFSKNNKPVTVGKFVAYKRKE